MNTKSTFVAVAAAVLLAGGALGFAIGRTTGGDHMNGAADTGSAGHMMGSMGGNGPGWSGPMMQMGAMPGMTMTGNGRMAMGDQAFLAMMIPHHQMAVDMATIALDRGSDPEVRALASEIIDAQKAEIADMTSWYRDWYGTAPPRMDMSGSMAMMGMNMDMDELRSTREPDRVFLRMMIPHHAGAILMADMALAGTPRREVTALARTIVADQSLEIGEMQRMRARIAPPLG
jgi:uncharacterized protein (DUF305 family)